MTRRAVKFWGIVYLVAAVTLWHTGVAYAVFLDEGEDMKLGVRAYTSARIGTEQTDKTIVDHISGEHQVLTNFTFPVSSAGHLRQNRFFVEAEFNHELDRLLSKGFGPLALLNNLPFKTRRLAYHLVYRGEAEGIYDYGPSEFRTAVQSYDEALVPEFSGNEADIGRDRRRLRNVGFIRNRLFQAYVQATAGDLFLRFGRQILAWGETDAFRLLDNINPIDNGFGGFMIALDERRVPIDMLLANYYFGELGPIYEAHVEGFVAIDNAVGFEPGIPKGSAWALPNLGAPSAIQQDIRTEPARTIGNARGGFQFKFNAPVPLIEEATFGVAHYYTYFDLPRVQTYVSGRFPEAIKVGPGKDYLALTSQTAPRVQVTGGTTTFALPSRWARTIGLSGEPIVRSELAYFRGEPRHSQSQLDPWVYAVGGCAKGSIIEMDGGEFCTGGRRTGDSWNFVLGLDTNQWLRFLNDRQTFFITTQFFFRHLNGATKRRLLHQGDGQPPVFDGEVLPVPGYKQEPRATGTFSGAAQSVLVHHPVDQYLQTLLIQTAYMSGQIIPKLTMAYDWGGSFVALPELTFSRDPFRFTVSYAFLAAGRLKGGSGISLLRDRDNVLFQIEYVL